MDPLYLRKELIEERLKLENKSIQVNKDIQEINKEIKHRIMVNCDKCKGTGKRIHADGLPTDCEHCSGRGYQCMRPYQDKITYL